jgi:hypothetical protein
MGWIRRQASRLRTAVVRVGKSPDYALERETARRWRVLRVGAVSRAVWSSLTAVLPDVREVEFRGSDAPAEDARGAGCVTTLLLLDRVPDAETVRALRAAGFDRIVLRAAPSEEAVRRAARAGIDRVDLAFSDEKREVEQARRLASGLGLALTTARRPLGERPVCEEDPRDALHVHADGSVAPCPALGGRVSFGRLPAESLEDIWEKEEYRAFRAAFHQREVIRDRRFFGRIGGCHTQFYDSMERSSEDLPPVPAPCKGCRHLREERGDESMLG